MTNHSRFTLLLGAMAAFCASEPARAAAYDPAEVQQRTVVLGAGEQRGVAVPCPSGWRIVGGGVGTLDSVDSKILVSGPLDETGLTANTGDGDVARSWYAAVYNGGTIARAYRVFALCSLVSDAVVQATTVAVPPGSTHAAGYTTCPAGTRVVGGGIGTTHPVIDRPRLRDAAWQLMHNGPLDESGTTAGTTDGDVGRYWYASLKKFHDGPADVYKVFALCSSRSDAVVAVGSMSVPAGGARAVAARCPAGKAVTGGGIGTPESPVSDHLQVSGPLDRTGLTVNTIDDDLAVFWYGSVFNSGSAARAYKVFALCATVPTLF
jgi:hypothetical protein